MGEDVSRSSKKASIHELGAPLDDISIDELHERIDALKAEIKRLEAAIEDKKSSKSAADSVFKF
ncbi:DUF1192 domain-containing protein [Maritalea mediterranea]|uniref:DUF1192 domain-containing protein n=1 Tax=Maritalea mediterranea TaxID=2909667 RepID=A0ABS9ED16_9HYPH|nr:DUF1192 domain-containing protein [Maritalea mediterranea]MCF4099645.1 DUF1192 domain-containing protein [Maritalea mediterranea]